MTIHFKDRALAECGRWSLVESIHASSNPREVNCPVCIKIMKKVFKPKNSMKWSVSEWNDFIGTPSVTTNKKENL